MTTAIEDELAGLARVMGYRHRGDPDFADNQLLTKTDQLHRQRRLTHAQIGASSHVHRQTIALRQTLDTLDVIRVFMGDQYRGQLMRAQPRCGQPLLGGAQTEAAIHQQPGPAIFNQSGVAPTATPERAIAHFSSGCRGSGGAVPWPGWNRCWYR